MKARSALGRLWPRRIHARLALLYAVLFLAAGSALLALTYALLASRLPTPPPSAKVTVPAVCKQTHALPAAKQPQMPPAKARQAHAPSAGKPAKASSTASLSVLDKCTLAYAAGALDQRDHTLTTLLDASLIGLGIATFVSAGLGWIVSGRVPKPVRSITERARQAADLELGTRLALAGPADELKELADTFDTMLERLDAAFASQKRFVANAAHELRTPLTAMRTAIEVTLSKPARTPEQLEAMALRVKRSVERAQNIIDALLTLASSELAPLASDTVDLAIAAKDALDGSATAISERRLNVAVDLEAARARGDDVLLDRMIANLVDNAVRHNAPGGWIGIRTAQTDDGALFEIANTGPSISDKDIPALFEPFGRAAQRLHTDNGLGLGLSIAAAIARAHDATLTAHSRAGGGLEMPVLIARNGS
jgi:signal transduction histidine kinase